MKKINQTERRIILNDLLQYEGGYTMPELIGQFFKQGYDTCRRTLLKDMDYLRDVKHIPMANELYRGRRKLYRYLNTDDSAVFVEDVTDDAKEKIHDAVNVLAGIKGNPHTDWLRLCLMQIEKGDRDTSKSIISFENNPKLTGIGHVSRLADTIRNEQPIRFNYKPYGVPQTEIHVHPYHLKQYNNRWFLIGRPDDKDVIYNYALDRIRGEIEDFAIPYIPAKVDISTYFDDVIGVSINDVDLVDVVLKVSRQRYNYLKTKPIHHTQDEIQERSTEDDVCLKIRVKPNKELRALILSYGKDMEVLEPASLRDEIKECIDQMKEKYE